MRKENQALEALYEAIMRRLPRTVLYKKAVTTSSIYCKMQDGHSLRIGDHKGKEKYSYKWNLSPMYPKEGKWRKEFNRIDGKSYWRFYCSSVERLALVIEASETHTPVSVKSALYNAEKLLHQIKEQKHERQ